MTLPPGHSGLCSLIPTFGLGCPYTRWTTMRAAIATSDALAAAVMILALVTTVMLLCKVLRLVRIVARPLVALREPLRRHARAGSWAVVTGASDGIGREFALQLAQKFGVHVVLVSRNKEKLDAVAASIETTTRGASETLVLPMDLARAGEDTWAALEAALKPLDVGVLVNCAGLSHELPVAFASEAPERLSDIVQLNDTAAVRVARLVLPAMVLKRRGCIVNIGSYAGAVHVPYLSVYSASKAFLRWWSVCLAEEVRSAGVAVHNLNTLFVTTNMSKIRRSSWSTPTPAAYVRAALRRVGSACRSEADVTPYPAHAILNEVYSWVPRWLLLRSTIRMSLAMRARGLRRSGSGSVASAEERASDAAPDTPRRSRRSKRD